MNITFILGNGFDIQCGLKSRYSDFLKEYTIIQESDSDNIKRFKQYLFQDKDKKLWSDAEKAMGIHLQDFSNTNVDDFTERIIDFELKMMDYLQVQQSRCSWVKRTNIYSIFEDFLFRSFEDIVSRKDDLFRATLIEKNKYQFITFNYTDLLDNILKIIRELMYATISIEKSSIIGNIYHIHGTLESSIIMGVNDAGQIRLGDGIKLTDRLKRQLIKPIMSSDIDHRWDAPAMRVIHESDIIVIYGVSFGETDNIWWEKIREWLEADENHKIVAFVRTEKKGPVHRLVWQLIEYEYEECPKILQKLGYKTDHPKYSQLLEQIYTIPNTTRLNLKSIILNDDLTDLAAANEISSTAEMV